MPQMRILAQQSGGRRQKVWLSVKSKCGNWHKVVLFEVKLSERPEPQAFTR